MLRFGIMCAGRSFPQWQASVIRRLLERGDAAPALLIVRAASAAPKRPGTLDALRKPKLLWRLYRRCNQPRALAPISLDAELAGVPQIVCATTRKGRFSEYFSAHDVERIRGYDLDFILRFSFGIIRGDVLESARYGVWSFHHGDETRYRGGPPGFWEIERGDPVCGAVLQRLTDRLDAGIILRRGYFKTIDYSYARNVNHLFMGTVEWPASVAAEIRATGDTAVARPPSGSSAPILVAPTNLQMLRFGIRLGRNVLRRIVKRMQREEWNVGIAPITREQVLRGCRVSGVRWHPRLRDGWIADPMARSVDGTLHVLCERMNLPANKAHIASITFDGKNWNGERSVIEPSCHASYPYLFTDGSDVFCVPETAAAHRVAMFRSVEFPKRWEYTGTLVDGVSLVDSTVFKFEDYWWLLCTAADATAERLLAYYALDPRGPWQPHALNPVKIDVRCSRPAGPPFWYEGRCYRPAQDSSRSYGGRIAVNRIERLTPTEFCEETVAYVEPDPRAPYGEGLHTLSFAGDRCVIDGKRYRWKRIGR